MKKTTFLIVGKHAVLEALKNPDRKIRVWERGAFSILEARNQACSKGYGFQASCRDTL